MNFTNSAIEDILTRELKTLCVTCVHQDHCVYYRTSRKAIIQCELFELDQEQPDTHTKGLCASCDNASRCTLPGRRHGVWHCNEFV